MKLTQFAAPAPTPTPGGGGLSGAWQPNPTLGLPGIDPSLLDKALGWLQTGGMIIAVFAFTVAAIMLILQRQGRDFGSTAAAWMPRIIIGALCLGIASQIIPAIAT